MTQLNPPANKPRISASDRLGFTLFLALTLHALVVLGVGFTHTRSPQSNALPSLDIILANSRSLEAVERPDYLAQEDQAGGGKADEKARPSAPISANTPLDQRGLADQARAELHKSQLAINQLYYISQVDSPNSINQQQQEKLQQSESKQSDQIDQQQSAIARLQAEIRKMTIDYAKRPKIVVLTASTKKAIEAGYLAAWVQRIESIGNLNYPAEARINKIDGQLRMSVRLNADGEILEVVITKSSGSSLLDEAARRILRLAQPFPEFPLEMREQADQVVIIRTWDFNSNRFRTNNGVS
ncbi:MAG: energy transducer TonB [Gammaproteobacteria bacterium]|nr:energy transducer TonB [Gammaproteobacteria bacterium]